MNSRNAITPPHTPGLDLNDTFDASEAKREVKATSDQGASDVPIRRQHWREKTGWPARCTTASGFSWECWVVDHSIGGLGLSHCPELRVDQVVKIKLTDIGLFHCRVAWSDQSRCGLQFIDDPYQASVSEIEAMVSLLPKLEDQQSTTPRIVEEHAIDRRRVFRWFAKKSSQLASEAHAGIASFNG